MLVARTLTVRDASAGNGGTPIVSRNNGGTHDCSEPESFFTEQFNYVKTPDSSTRRQLVICRLYKGGR